MSAHTPGPWRIGDAGYTVFGPPNGSPSPKTIANIPFKSGDGKSNALLIAAAPDLLAALTSVIDAYMTDKFDPVVMADACQSGRTIIARLRSAGFSPKDAKAQAARDSAVYREPRQ